MKSTYMNVRIMYALKQMMKEISFTRKNYKLTEEPSPCQPRVSPGPGRPPTGNNGRRCGISDPFHGNPGPPAFSLPDQKPDNG